MESDVGAFVAQLMNLLDPSKTQEASRFVLELINTNAVEALRLSVAVINSPEAPPFAVKQCLQIINTVFRPSYSVSHSFLKTKWLRFPLNQRNQIQSALLKGLFQEDPVTRNIASVDLALIGSFDWSSMKETLLEYLSQPFTEPAKFSDNCRLGCIQVLNEFVFRKMLRPGDPIAEQKSLAVMPWFAGYIDNLTDADGPKAVELNELVKILRTLFPVFGIFFTDAGNRTQLLDLIMRKLGIPNTLVHASLYGLLYEVVVQFYRDSLVDGNRTMELTFSASITSIESGNVECAIAALEFWRKLAIFEKHVYDEAENIERARDSLDYLGLIEKGCESLMPAIFRSLVKLDESADFDDPNRVEISISAAKCLRAISVVAPKFVFERVSSAASEMVRNESWSVRAGGILALWAILRGEEKMKRRELFLAVFPTLTSSCLSDPSPIVTWAALRVLKGMLREFEIGNDLSVASQMLQTVVSIDKDSLMVKRQAMMLVNNYARWCHAFSDRATLRNHPGQPIFTNLMVYLTEQLAAAESREDEYMGIVVDAAFAVISAADVQDMNIRNHVMERLAQFVERIGLLGQSLAGTVDRQMIIKNMVSYCALITSALVVLKGHLMESEEMAVNVLAVLTKCLDLRDEMLFDEALISVAAAIPSLTSYLPPIIGQINQHILWALSIKSPETMRLACMCVFKLLNYCPDALAPVSGDLIGLLETNLNDNNCPIRVQQEIIRNIGAIVRFTGDFGLSKAPEYYERLKGFSTLNLNIEGSETDREIADGYFDAVIYGFHAVLVVADKVGLDAQFCREYRLIDNFFKKLARYPMIFTEQLMDSAVNYISDLVRLCAKPLNVYLHRQCIFEILDEAAEHFGSSIATAVKREIQKL